MVEEDVEGEGWVRVKRTSHARFGDGLTSAFPLESHDPVAELILEAVIYGGGYGDDSQG